MFVLLVNTSGQRAHLSLLHCLLSSAAIILLDISARGFLATTPTLASSWFCRNMFGTKNPELSILHTLKLNTSSAAFSTPTPIHRLWLQLAVHHSLKNVYHGPQE